jgi:dihydropteroate synthase
MTRTITVGIVNCTPDSFSDGIHAAIDPINGARVLSATCFLDRAQALLDAGADMLDIGGDSTRPGSHCTEDEEEWRRIEGVISHFSHRVPISVDTHKSEIARRAIDLGVAMINDITGGLNSELVEVVARSNVLYTYMFNAYGAAHDFTTAFKPVSLEDCTSTLSLWAAERADTLNRSGIGIARQVMDPGMGAFVSPDPAVSFSIIENFWSIRSPVKKRMLGCSRKGFLKQSNEQSILERDALSSALALKVSEAAPEEASLYVRTHNPQHKPLKTPLF